MQDRFFISENGVYSNREHAMKQMAVLIFLDNGTGKHQRLWKK